MLMHFGSMMWALSSSKQWFLTCYILSLNSSFIIHCGLLRDVGTKDHVPRAIKNLEPMQRPYMTMKISIKALNSISIGSMPTS